jgi:four helix bundle protein
MGDYRTLLAYQKAFKLTMRIYFLTKKFPTEEKFGLISQIRNASRSVCANIVEAYKRRRYKDYFISKLNDAETENAETQVWLDIALECQYVSPENYQELKNENDEVAKLILYMINNPEKFL